MLHYNFINLIIIRQLLNFTSWFISDSQTYMNHIEYFTQCNILTIDLPDMAKMTHLQIKHGTFRI